MFFNTISSRITIIYKNWKKEEQAVSEQLSDFNMWSFTALKNLNNYNMTITNISDNMIKSRVWCLLSLVLIFELIQQAVLVSFMLFLNILNDHNE